MKREGIPAAPHHPGFGAPVHLVLPCSMEHLCFTRHVTGVDMPCDGFQVFCNILWLVSVPTCRPLRQCSSLHQPSVAPLCGTCSCRGVHLTSTGCRMRRTSACGRCTNTCGGMPHDTASCPFFVALCTGTGTAPAIGASAGATWTAQRSTGPDDRQCRWKAAGCPGRAQVKSVGTVMCSCD